MKLVPDWKKVLKRAWSVRLASVAAVLGGLEVAMQQLQPSFPSGRFAMAAALVSAAAALARVVAQTKMFDDEPPEENPCPK